MLSHFCMFTVLIIHNYWSFQYSSAMFLSHITILIPCNKFGVGFPKFLLFLVANFNFLCI